MSKAPGKRPQGAVDKAISLAKKKVKAPDVRSNVDNDYFFTRGSGVAVPILVSDGSVTQPYGRALALGHQLWMIRDTCMAVICEGI